MSPRVDRLWQARVFLEAATTSTFRDAAERLDRRPSTVTTVINLLEAETGDDRPLFVRGRHGTHLTRDGEMLLPAARKLVDAADLFDATLTQIDATTRLVRIGTIQGAWFDIVARAQQLIEHDVELEPVALDPYWPVQPLLNGAINYALLPVPSDHDAQLHRIPIFTEPRCVSTSASGHLAGLRSATLQQVDEGTWIGSPPGADRLFTTAHSCDDLRGGPPPHKGRTHILNPIDIGHAIRNGDIQIGSMASITQMFAGLLTDGVMDVQIDNTPPWTIDLATLLHNKNDLTRQLAIALRQAAPEANIPGLETLPEHA